MSNELLCYGLDLSYFTGKVEAFLRYRQIPHRRIELSSRLFRDIARITGKAQMPAIQLPDGRWLTDSTAMIAWLDQTMPGPKVIPEAPLARFVALLVEDYADEWLWRPALHYRWSFEPDATLMSHRIASEMLHDLPLPLWLRRWMIHRRQIRKYVRGDGITSATRAHVEAIYLRNLDALQKILTASPYVMGQRPTIVDFGFFASMFRHFGLDPTPARIMRDRAPAVFEWLARLWNAKGNDFAHNAMPDQVPDALAPILAEVALAYLPYLAANANAFAEGRKHFTFETEGVTYHLPVHPYRVWCLERLQEHVRALGQADLRDLQALLRPWGGGPALLAEPIASRYDPRGLLPFCPPA